jgi:hypothetical protein
MVKSLLQRSMKQSAFAPAKQAEMLFSNNSFQGLIDALCLTYLRFEVTPFNLIGATNPLQLNLTATERT